MGRGVAFTLTEDDFLIINADSKTAQELSDLHDQSRGDSLWPGRSKKSLARRIERLREEGKLGLRDEETRRKAYYSRHNKKD